MNNWLWNYPPRDAWRRLRVECLVLVALGGIIGLSANVSVLRQVWNEEVAPPRVSTEEQLPEPVMLEEVVALLAEGALAVDARLPEQFVQGHLPGAYNLPLADIETALAPFVEQVATTRKLVVYCNGYGCPDSFDLAGLLIRDGFVGARVFEGGFPEWQAAGLPVQGGVP